MSHTIEKSNFQLFLGMHLMRLLQACCPGMHGQHSFAADGKLQSALFCYAQVPCDALVAKLIEAFVALPPLLLDLYCHVQKDGPPCKAGDPIKQTPHQERQASRA